jgi:hypothetical protein
VLDLRSSVVIKLHKDGTLLPKHRIWQITRSVFYCILFGAFLLVNIRILKASNMPGSNMYATATSTSALTGFPVRPVWHVFRLQYKESSVDVMGLGIG